MRPREYGGNNITGLQGAGAWVASSAELMRLVASIDGKPGVKDILSAESVKILNGWGASDGFGWAYFYSENKNLIRTGTMSGTCAYIEHRVDDTSFVLLTNTSHYRGASFTKSIGRTIRIALSRVSEWPEDRDLFVGTPKVEVATEQANI